ncbi:MAG: tRNA-uridine aminocarboxypropyltransferase [Aestuariibacter sp.]
MSRRYCSTCDFPATACVCHALTNITSNTRIHILQHSSEVKAAKGTVRLLQLILPDTQVYVGETPDDFKIVKEQVTKNTDSWALLYPNDDAVLASAISTQNIQNLIAIDGTWKKAYRILQLNTWLQDITAVSFSGDIQSRYRIRKAKIPNSFSTLESVGLCLHELEGTPLSAFEKVLEARMKTFEQYSSQHE